MKSDGQSNVAMVAQQANQLKSKLAVAEARITDLIQHQGRLRVAADSKLEQAAVSHAAVSRELNTLKVGLV